MNMKVVMLLVTVFCSISGLGFAAEFGTNSAIVTNPYSPMQVGNRLTYAGTGTFAGYGRYLEAVDTEVVDTVNCLKVLIKGHGNHSDPDQDPEWYYLWCAEDSNQNVRMLQIYNAEENEMITFGKTNAVLWMPAHPIVGQVFAQVYNEYMQVMEIGVTVSQLTTGLGPFTNCMKAKWSEGGSDEDISYIAPNVGSVKEEWGDDGEINGWELAQIIHGGAGIGCATVDSNLNLMISCADYSGYKFELTLNHYVNPSDPFGIYWELGNVNTVTCDCGGGCTTVDNNLNITMPCFGYDGIQYDIVVILEHYIDPQNPFGFYWKLSH